MQVDSLTQEQRSFSNQPLYDAILNYYRWRNDCIKTLSSVKEITNVIIREAQSVHHSQEEHQCPAGASEADR